jgi:hypothetical protein
MKKSRDPIKEHKQAAKRLLQAYKANDAQAVSRVHRYIRSARQHGEPVGIQKCQYVIAQELGYADWTDMLDEERV